MLFALKHHGLFSTRISKSFYIHSGIVRTCVCLCVSQARGGGVLGTNFLHFRCGLELLFIRRVLERCVVGRGRVDHWPPLKAIDLAASKRHLPVFNGTLSIGRRGERGVGVVGAMNIAC